MSEAVPKKTTKTPRAEINDHTEAVTEGPQDSTGEIHPAGETRVPAAADGILKYVIRLRDSGLSSIPIRADGSKQPALLFWKEYQRRLPTSIELTKWFGKTSRQGIAVIGGRVSGNLEVIDIDSPEITDKWRSLVERQIPGLLAGLPQVKTPSGGLHVYYRCKVITGSAKLAESMAGNDEWSSVARGRDHRRIRFKTTIETRGEGGYVITTGSAPACHPSGKPYILVNGALDDIPEITEIARDVALDCARLFNERRISLPAPEPNRAKRTPCGFRPGDDFNRRGDTRPTLEKHGWRYLRKGPRGELWRRPGVDHTSATLFHDGSLYVFSSNAHPFKHNRRYNKFSIYALLEHDGDWNSAARDLADQGYGGPRRRG